MELMEFALTTRWNASRHSDGEAMVNEILDLGINHLELGYDLRMDLVPGVKKMVDEGTVCVDSLHNYCPIPLGAPRGPPELFTLSDPDPQVRRRAVEHTGKTIAFAAEIGASRIVIHAGNVSMPRMTEQIATLCQADKQFSPRYEKLKLKLQVLRQKKVAKQLPFLYEGLEALLPTLDEYDIRLGIENLPTWEAIPTEIEIETLLKHFNTPRLGYWHDIGHGQIRQNLGLINQDRWLERLAPYLLGMHIHDVAYPVYDHVMPPRGNIDFSRFVKFAKLPVLKVFEPSRKEAPDGIRKGLEVVRSAWEEISGEDS